MEFSKCISLNPDNISDAIPLLSSMTPPTGTFGSPQYRNSMRELDSVVAEISELEDIPLETTICSDKDPADPHVYRVVLTGGPCGGKTTALSTISDYLRSLGTQVFIVPENATIFANGGAGFPVHAAKAQQMCWESSRILCQMQMENSFARIAKSSGKPTVMLCDRGTIDAAAYMDTQRWHELLAEMGWETDMLREDRYDAVIHLISAAIGAEEYYTLTTNTSRRETVQEAAEVDLKIRGVWAGHPHVEIIDNSTDFPQKIVRVVKAICRILGVRAPTSNGVFKIFNIDMSFKENLSTLCLRFEEFFLQNDFLKNSSEDEHQCVRHRRQHDHGSELSLYTWTSRTMMSNGAYAIEERAITSKEYFALLKQGDPEIAPVQRWRRCFVYQDQYFQLDEYEDMLLLSVEVESEESIVDLPPWISGQVINEVTHDPNYTVFATAKRLRNKPHQEGRQISSVKSPLAFGPVRRGISDISSLPSSSPAILPKSTESEVAALNLGESFNAESTNSPPK